LNTCSLCFKFISIYDNRGLHKEVEASLLRLCIVGFLPKWEWYKKSQCINVMGEELKSHPSKLHISGEPHCCHGNNDIIIHFIMVEIIGRRHVFAPTELPVYKSILLVPFKERLDNLLITCFRCSRSSYCSWLTSFYLKRTPHKMYLITLPHGH